MVQGCNKLRMKASEYNRLMDEKLQGADTKLQNIKSWQLTNQLYGTQEMIKRTVNDIYKRTYNLNAEKGGVQLGRDFSHQKTWKSLMSDPRFK